MAAVNSGVLFLSLRFVAVQCMCTFVLMLCMDRTGQECCLLFSLESWFGF